MATLWLPGRCWFHLEVSSSASTPVPPAIVVFHILMPFWVGGRGTTRFFWPISCYFYGPRPNQIDSESELELESAAQSVRCGLAADLKKLKLLHRNCLDRWFMCAFVVGSFGLFFSFSYIISASKSPVGQQANLCGFWYLLAGARALASIVYAIWEVDYAFH